MRGKHFFLYLSCADAKHRLRFQYHAHYQPCSDLPDLMPIVVFSHKETLPSVTPRMGIPMRLLPILQEPRLSTHLHYLVEKALKRNDD